MINCIINKTSYIYKTTPKSKNLEFPYPLKAQTDYFKNNSYVTNTYISRTPIVGSSPCQNKPTLKKINYGLNNLLLTKHTFIKDLTSNFQKNQNIPKYNNTLLILKVQYKKTIISIYLKKNDNSLFVAQKIKNEFNLNLSQYQLNLLGKKIAAEINNAIDAISNNNNNIHNFGVVLNIDELIKTFSTKINIKISFGKNNYNYYIHEIGYEDEIDNIIEEVLQHLSKKANYDKDGLKKQIEKSVNESIDARIKKK